MFQNINWRSPFGIHLSLSSVKFPLDMVPETSSISSSIHSRSLFSWDLKTVPWTDEKGPQDAYSDIFAEWCNFHDILPEKNADKLGYKLRGSFLKS